MKIAIIGGGPGGLYLAILMKLADAAHDIVVHERNGPDDTFGFGVVFSDETMDNIRAADPATFAAIADAFAHWTDIHVNVAGETFVSTGHGFSGMSRKTLLNILQARAGELGVALRFNSAVDDPATLDADLVVAADGVNSAVRERYGDAFGPTVDLRPNRFVWLGTTVPYGAFTFHFKMSEHGLWRVHAYRYSAGESTFIVECREDTWRAAGMDRADEAETLAFCEALFADELDGHRLLANRSIWRQVPTIRCARWHHRNVVLLGDAVHTAHFSIGSGTKLAMEDAIALAGALNAGHAGLGAALDAYQAERQPQVESTQRAAQTSLEWFEHTERYGDVAPLQFAFGLLTRSMRITHSNLKERDPALVERVDAWVAERAAHQAGVALPRGGPDGTPPPMFTPYRLRDLVLANRVVVSPMCMYSAVDGTPNDWHLVHLGSRALGGAGLVITEMTDVSADGRISPGCAGMYEDAHGRAWKRVVDFVHANSAAKICVQLAHAGRKGSTKRLWEGMDEPLDDGNWPLIAPSPIPYKPGSQVPQQMNRFDMEQVIMDFERATRMADEAGFDMVEVHLAHGYLLGSFLSPLTNVRTDEFGGSLENRMTFPLEVFAAVRDLWPQHKPVSARISATDWKQGGFNPDDAVFVARALKALGCDIVDVSAGQTVDDDAPVYGRCFQTPFSDKVRQEADMPTMTVGNISSYGDVNSIVAAGRADLVVLARAHLYDPYWTRHAAFEQGWPLAWPPQYRTLDRYTPRMEWSPRGSEGGVKRT
ncbi:MAG: bifunctional salicylyl-CoA 5-hydroxylase/oxidoreductase [Alphaproteobacteria bacterium]